MTPRTRVYATVAAAAVLVAGAVVAVTWLQTRGESTTVALHPRSGVPPLLFDYGVENDAETRDLARGVQLLNAGKRARAAALFAKYRSLQAQLGTAFTRWPDLDAVERLAAQHPQSAVAQLELGLALVWAGRGADGVKALQRVDTQFPDSPSAVDAENLLFSRDVPGLPFLVVPVTIPQAPTLAEQVAIARRAAERGGAQAKLTYGVVLWRLQHRVSANRWLSAAARLDPTPVTETAAAVSAFTKRAPVAAFGRLGPLTGKYPHAAVVRFHLGLLLLWTRQLDKARKQLRIAIREAPDSLYAKEAEKLLAAITRTGTK